MSVAKPNRQLLNGLTNCGMIRQVAADPPSDSSLDDALTGFGNRRKLVVDLTEALKPTAAPTLFAIFNLSGFDHFLALYGQLEADALLKRLAGRVSNKLDASATCYRPRHDELAALLRSPIETAHPMLEATLAVLRTRDRRASITPAFGAVILPGEAHDVAEVMMLADQRLALTAPAQRPRERRRKHRRRARSSGV